MNQLPIWNFPATIPAVWDMESATAIEQAARVYTAMRELISEYNKFAEITNKQLSEFTETEQENREKFEENITKVMRGCICSIEREFKINLEPTIGKMLNEAIASGDIKITEVYDPETESLTMVVGGEV